MTISYKITFLDFWHCGSGVSGGAKYDNMPIQDKDGFPYIPGKTIKGVLRDIAKDSPLKDMCFGTKDNRTLLHFSNAELNITTKNTIKEQNLAYFLFSKITQTAIDKKSGTAKDGSLRTLLVVKPLELYAQIDNVNENCIEYLSKTLQSLRQMGLNRTRGLGRLKIDILEVCKNAGITL